MSYLLRGRDLGRHDSNKQVPQTTERICKMLWRSETVSEVRGGNGVEVERKGESRCFAKDVKNRARAAKSIINYAMSLAATGLVRL